MIIIMNGQEADCTLVRVVKDAVSDNRAIKECERSICEKCMWNKNYADSVELELVEMTDAQVMALKQRNKEYPIKAYKLMAYRRKRK